MLLNKISCAHLCFAGFHYCGSTACGESQSNGGYLVCTTAGYLVWTTVWQTRTDYSCIIALQQHLPVVCSFGAQPEWAVFSESFPVGCRFSSSIPCPQFFSVNPDRRSRLYSSPMGMYKPGCGLSAVYMSWTAYEYLYLILIKNKTVLPPVARVGSKLGCDADI